MVSESYSFNYWPNILKNILLIVVIILIIIFRKKIIEFFKKNGFWCSIYKLSFLVYIIIGVWCLYSAFFGILGLTFFGTTAETLYGFEAIRMCLGYVYLYSMLSIPVVPIIILYQIVYSVVRKVKRK